MAIHAPKRAEIGIILLLKGWLAYADQHKTQYDSGIGEDGYLGPQWAEIGHNLRNLLNGNLGRLDGGTLDSVICNALTKEGFDPDQI